MGEKRMIDGGDVFACFLLAGIAVQWLEWWARRQMPPVKQSRARRGPKVGLLIIRMRTGAL